jgi:hypothetical protein
VALRFLCASVWLAAGCAAQGTSPEAFTFAIIGDAPYKSREEPHFERMMERIDGEDVAFTIHVGDIGAGGVACSDAYYEKSLRRFERSRAPLIYTPGDNEWTDCRGARFDPLERLGRLREVFFGDEYSLGRTKLPTEVQRDRAAECGAYPENRAWSRSGVRFVTINVPAPGRERNAATRRTAAGERAVAARKGRDPRAGDRDAGQPGTTQGLRAHARDDRERRASCESLCRRHPQHAWTCRSPMRSGRARRLTRGNLWKP